MIIGLIFLYTLYAAYQQRFKAPQLRWLSLIAAVLFAAQVVVGAATVLMNFPAELRALHLSLATLIWGTVAALATLSLIVSGEDLPEASNA